MKNELFNPANNCNPILPLNEITNKISFYRINVFDKTIDDMFQYTKDGIITGKVEKSDRYKNTLRLGIPLTEIFPQIQEVYPVRFLSGQNVDSMRIGIEGVYIPFKDDYPSPQKITELTAFGDDLSKGYIKYNGKNINLDGMKPALDNLSYAYYKSGKNLIKISLPPKIIEINDSDLMNGKLNTNLGKIPLNQIQLNELKSNSFTKTVFRGNNFYIHKTNDSLNAGRKSAFSLSIVPNLDPSTMPDDLYFEVLGDLLNDKRSNLTGKGKDSQLINSAVLDDDDFYKLFALFKSDPRYQMYLNKLLPSEMLVESRPKLPSYEIGLFTTYEQTWELLGYSRGSIISSITLAPNEELTIEVFSYDRLKVEQEKNVSTEFESNSEISSLSKASSQIANNLSETTDSKADIGLGIPLPVQGVPVKIDANTGVNDQLKSGIQATVDQINETTVKTSEKFKASNQIKIVQTEESGLETRTTRKLRNPNGSRTLTFNHYEILEAYRVTTKLKDTKRFCVLVENPDLGAIDINFVLANEDKLQKALLSPVYLKGFDAAQKLAAQRWFDKKSETKAEIENANKLTGGANTSEPQSPQKPIVTISVNLMKTLNKFLNADLMKAADVLNKYYDPTRPNNQKPSKKKVSDANDVLGLFNFWLKFKIAYPGVESKAMDYVTAVSENPPEKTAVEQLGLFLAGMDDEWLTSLKMIAVNLVSIQLASLLAPFFIFLVPVFFELALVDNNSGLPSLIEKAKKELKNYEVATSAKTSLPANDSSQTPVPAQPQPPQLYTLQEIAEANGEFEKLALHIEANKTYYLNKIWFFEDSNARLERLKIKGLLNFVENRLLGFVGNKSVFPLRFESLSDYTQQVLTKQLASFNPDKSGDAKSKKGDGSGVSKIVPKVETVSLPTNGVYMDSILGKCDSLEEYLINHRLLDLREKEAEVKTKEEEAKQAEKETLRYDLRLNQNPPVLDFPQPPKV